MQDLYKECRIAQPGIPRRISMMPRSPLRAVPLPRCDSLNTTVPSVVEFARPPQCDQLYTDQRENKKKSEARGNEPAVPGLVAKRVL